MKFSVDKAAIVKAITKAEEGTSAEIKVRIEKKFKGNNVFAHAKKVFAKLGLHKTEKHNAVLIYLAYQNRGAAIIGDSGINAKVPENFWNDVYERMRLLFAQGDFTQGLVVASEMTGEKLKEFFPVESNDINEIENQVSDEKLR